MNNPIWEKEIEIIKSILNQTELQVKIKWGTDIYCLNDKNVIGVGAFKKHFAIWFYNGVFLKDEQKVLISADENTKALRQWRFTKNDIIDEKLILTYVYEAIENEKNGLVWKSQKSEKILVFPEIFLNAFFDDLEFKDAFEKLTFYKQKEYINYILQAKRIETQTNRMQKIIPMIKLQLELNGKYK